MVRMKYGVRTLGACGVCLVLAACGGSSGSSASPSSPGNNATYTIGGTITGLSAGGLVLADGSQTVSPTASAASFTFGTAVAASTSYSVTVSTQPSGETCTVANGSGTVASANVTGVQVACAANNMSGTAATGSPIPGATVTLVDSKGAQVAAKTDSNGQYSLSTSGMTAPFLVKVVTASASANGYAAGTIFYGVSDQAMPTTINVTPLTDLIIRDWYAAQSAPVSIDTAFASPTANPPPSAAEVQLVQAVVLDIVQPVLQQSGVNPVGLDLISGSFSANGQGVDAALDQIKPITYNSAGTSATVTIKTTSTTTQTTTVTTSSGNTQVATTTSDTSSGATSSIVTSAVVPTSAGEAAALAGAQATLTAIGNVIQSKGSALQAADIAPYIDTSYLNGGETASQQAQEIAQLAGATINSFTVSQIATYDSTNNLIGIVGTLSYTVSGVTGLSKLGYGSDLGVIFKEEANGSWLLYGDQQQAKSNASIESVTNNQLDGTTWSGQILQLQVAVPAASTSTPCSSTYASSVTAFPATAIAGTSQGNNAPVTIGTGGYALQEDSVVYQDNKGNTCQFDGLANSLLVLPAGSLPGVVGDKIGFAVNGGAQIPGLARTIPGYTTEAINFTNLSGHALSSVQLGQALTLKWSLPVTFPIYDVEVYGDVYAPNGSSYVACGIKPTTPLGVTSTSVTLTLPATCNGSAVASIPQPGPAAVQLNVVVLGTHGEMANAWWAYN
ncbi:MAG: hypothetical protein KGO22_14940 [Gammaproteobacteria bacterium]|nr:hypothetical protein [Gammaproteobacteria bacterium]